LTPRPTLGALEAHAARAEVYTLTGDLAAGRRAVADMMDVAEHLPGPTTQAGAGPYERAVFFRAFLECWVGDQASIEAACDEANRALAHLPMWLIELRVYRARAMVAAGDISGGIAYALHRPSASCDTAYGSSPLPSGTCARQCPPVTGATTWPNSGGTPTRPLVPGKPSGKEAEDPTGEYRLIVRHMTQFPADVDESYNSPRALRATSSNTAITVPAPTISP